MKIALLLYMLKAEAKVITDLKRNLQVFTENGKKRKISTIVFSRKLETGVKGTKIDSSFDNILIKKEDNR